MKNLWFLASGDKYQNFVEALSSVKLEQIMVNLRYAYDVVIIDTPPLELVADGLLLAHCVMVCSLLLALSRFVAFSEEKP